MTNLAMLREDRREGKGSICVAEMGGKQDRAEKPLEIKSSKKKKKPTKA